MEKQDGLYFPHGGYRRLQSFIKARLVYDATVRFCDAYIDRRSRTHDQMVQAARSGVQNIAEGSVASGTSRNIEIKLTNVAKASLEELRLDYEDFLRHNALPLWPDDDFRRRKIAEARLETLEQLHELLANPSEWNGASARERSANAIHVLCGIAAYLLARQLKRLEKNFLEEGGFSERMSKKRIQAGKSFS